MQELIDMISCVLYLQTIKKQPAFEGGERSIGYRIIPKNITTEILEALGASLKLY